MHTKSKESNGIVYPSFINYQNAIYQDFHGIIIMMISYFS